MSPKDPKLSSNMWIQLPLVLTIATVAVYGGRITERLDNVLDVQRDQTEQMARQATRLAEQGANMNALATRIERLERAVEGR